MERHRWVKKTRSLLTWGTESAPFPQHFRSFSTINPEKKKVKTRQETQQAVPAEELPVAQGAEGNNGN
jgi:hypothetical protein